MLTTILSYLTEGLTYTALEICEVNGETLFYALEVKKSKNELNITKKAILSNLEEVSDFVQKGLPLVISINTSQILTKSIANSNNTNPEAIVNNAFPNLDTSHFYYEVTQLSQKPIVTIAKKEYVDAFLKKITDLKIPLIGFSLGINAISSITTYFNKNIIQGSNFQVTLQENTITRIDYQNNSHTQQYELNGLAIDNTHILSFASIITHLSTQLKTSNFSDLSKSYKQTYKNSRIFSISLKASLAFFIGILLINFLFFSHYHSKTESLSTAVEANSSQKNSLTLLNASVTKKEERLTILSASTNSITSYYLDELAHRIPHSMALDEIKYQPLLKPIRDSKLIELEKRTLLVSGISHNNQEFSLWLEELESQKWISIVKTLDYDYVSKNASHFTIKIELNETK